VLVQDTGRLATHSTRVEKWVETQAAQRSCVRQAMGPKEPASPGLRQQTRAASSNQTQNPKAQPEQAHSVMAE